MPRLKRQESISLLEPLLSGTWLGYFQADIDESGIELEQDDDALKCYKRVSLRLELDETNTISTSGGAIISSNGALATSDFYFYGELFNIGKGPDYPCGIHL